MKGTKGKYRKGKYRKGKKKEKLQYGRKKGVVLLAKSLKEHFPPALRTRLTTDASIIINIPAGTILTDASVAAIAFRGNSIIQVGPALGYNQNPLSTYALSYPAGIDYLLGQGLLTNTSSAPYRSFLVIKSWITVKLVESIAGATNDVARAVLAPIAYDPQSSAITQFVANMIEQPYAKSRLIPLLVTIPDGIVLKNYMSTKKMYGINKNITTDDKDYVGSWNTSPTNPWTWLLMINNVGPVITALNFTADVKITHDVIFFERNIFKSVAPT